MKTTSIGIIAAAMILLCVGPASAWYDGYGYRIPININNTGSALTNYQMNVSLSGIDADSIRVVNETAGAMIPHWCENVVGDNCYEIWFNVTSLPGGTWTNDTYYIYYHNDTASSTSSYDATFTKAHNPTKLILEFHMDEGAGHTTTIDSYNGRTAHLSSMTTGGGDPTSGWQGVDGGQWNGRSDMCFSTGDYLCFDGIDDYVWVSSATPLEVSDEMSVSMWVKPNQLSDNAGLFYKGSLANSPGVIQLCQDATGDLKFRINGAGQVTYAEPGTGVWTHVAATYDKDLASGNMKLYYNGVLKNSADYTTPITSDSRNVYIGAYHSPSYTFNGCIDEVCFYNRSLSAEEIYRQHIRSKYTPTEPSTSLGEVEIHERVLEGWQALGEDTTESYTDLVMIIGICVMIVIVGGIIIGLRSFAGEISPEILIIVAIAIGFGLLVLITVVEIVPSVMAPMENITMEGF